MPSAGGMLTGDLRANKKCDAVFTARKGARCEKLSRQLLGSNYSINQGSNYPCAANQAVGGE